MSLQPTSLAGTAFAYWPCGGCGHMWIRHAFSGRPRCTQSVIRGVLNSAGDVTPAPVQCDCAGWQEKGSNVTPEQPAAGQAGLGDISGPAGEPIGGQAAAAVPAPPVGEGGQATPAPAKPASIRQHAMTELHRAHSDYLAAVAEAHLRFIDEVGKVHRLLVQAAEHSHPGGES